MAPAPWAHPDRRAPHQGQPGSEVHAARSRAPDLDQTRTHLALTLEDALPHVADRLGG
ncbi:MAG: hypothetical protein R2726_20345 [Acidimicrobiales bacterium]